MLLRQNTTKSRPRSKKSAKPASRLTRRREKTRGTSRTTSEIAGRAVREVEGTKKRRQASSLELSLLNSLLQSLRNSHQSPLPLIKLQMSSLTDK